ncbi:MAG: hypothetical protein IPP13_22395 [Kouleothrix sp.]|jgi:hypothetical protein|nr:hypothetical protein [Kouleothrix sp.]
MARQNDIERLIDHMERDLLSVDEANVALVRMDRVRLVINKIPAPVRRALNEAVKRGELGHMKKDGHKPEAYFHPTFKQMAIAARNAREREVINALKKVAGWPL